MRRFLCYTLVLTFMLTLCACGRDIPVATEASDPTSSTNATTQTASAPETTPATEVVDETPARPVPDNIMAHYKMKNDQGRFVVYGTDSLSRSQITEISFLDTLANMPDTAWDVSEAQDGRVMAWTEGTHLYIAGNGGVTLSEDANCLFGNFENVTAIHFNDCLYTDLVVDWNGFFDYCVSLKSLDLSFFNTDSAETMANLFNHCESLTALDVSNFNTQYVRTMSQMFCGCYQLENLTLFSTSTANVHTFSEMFSGCEKLESLDLLWMNTSNGISFSAMFKNCRALKHLDLSSFDFSLAERTNYMFYNCSALTDIGCTITLRDDCNAEYMYEGSGLKP